MQSCQNKRHTCPNCHYSFTIRWDTEKTFLEWLKDRNHIYDHLMFIFGILFTLSLLLVLALAWMQATQTMAHSSWMLNLPVAVLLTLQTGTWLSFAAYNLWLYRKAYLHWKSQPTGRVPTLQEREVQAGHSGVAPVLP
ncbi:uncharacterized protein LOC144157825 [Haemaphysalis longicornis]